MWKSDKLDNLDKLIVSYVTQALCVQVASLQEEIDALGSLMANSTVSVVNCGSE